MTDRRLAIDAWESLFRAQHEVFEEISGDFDSALTQAEYDVPLAASSPSARILKTGAARSCVRRKKVPRPSAGWPLRTVARSQSGCRSSATMNWRSFAI
jgi:hypothetical protein